MKWKGRSTEPLADVSVAARSCRGPAAGLLRAKASGKLTTVAARLQ